MAIANQQSPKTNSQFIKYGFALALSSLVYGCGGGAGDDNEVTPMTNDAAIAAIAPLVGVWDLPDDWNGQEFDQAYLVINTADSSGEAEAKLFDQDDSVPSGEELCFFQDGFTGNVTQSSITDELFLEVSAFPFAIVELLPSGELQISNYLETADAGSPPERVLTAVPLGITENEISLCD